MLRHRILLPPWLLLAAISVGVQQTRQAPLQLSQLAPDFQQAAARLSAAQSPLDLPVPLFQILLRTAAAAAFWLPIAVIVVGALSVIAPHARARWVRRRFRLEPATPASAAAHEIAVFVQGRAPGTRLSWNLLRGDLTAFVYPLGYRATALAVFGGLIKLWRRDRAAAEAILLHELGHAANGDVALVGVGSLFDWLARRWVVLMLVAWAVPIAPLLAIGAQALIAGEIGAALSILGQYLGSVLILLPALLIQTVVVLLPLIVAFWCAELNADRCAINALGSAAPLIAALDAIRRPQRRREWLLARVTYPPDRLRRWSASHLLGFPGSLALLLVYPLASLIPFLLLTLALFLVSAPFGEGAAFAEGMGGNVASFVSATLVPVWGLSAAMTLVWPLVAARRAGTLLGEARLSWQVYLAGSGLVGGVALLAFLL